MITRAQGSTCIRASMLPAIVIAVIAAIAAAAVPAEAPRKAPPAPGSLGISVFVQEGFGPPRTVPARRIELPEARSAPAGAAEDTSFPRTAAGSSVGDVDGPVRLSVAKSWNGSAWDLVLSWTGQGGAVTVVASPYPEFESSVTTLEKGFAPPTLTVAERPSRPLECFDVTDGSTANRAIQGLGYDPDPPPLTPTAARVPAGTLDENDIWWNDIVRISAGYLDPIPSANFIGMQNRIVRAVGVDGVSGGFAASADFVVPEDARSHWMTPTANGLPARAADFLSLYPKGATVGPFSHMRAISWAPPTGHVWVADDTSVQSLDLFRIEPNRVHAFQGLQKPYLSRVSNTGRILFVEGSLGVAKVWQIDVGSGTRTEYANTTDAAFTRSIRPVGIAVTPDGAACYVADASPGENVGRIVRIPAGNASPIRDDYGAWPYWSFADPAGMEVGLDGTVFVGASNQWIGEIPDPTHTWWWSDTSGPVRSLLLDRELSSTSSARLWWSPFAGWAHAFNENPLASAGGQPRHVGATLVNEGNDKIDVAPQWEHLPVPAHVVWPARVILDRQGQPYDYLWPFQTDDRLTMLQVRGWSGVAMHLRLIDPPDLSPYAPSGGFPARGGKVAVPPYEANDNKVWDDAAYTDFGLTVDPSGALDPGEPWPVLDLDVAPGADNLATVYVKLPARYAGDNWQVQVNKMDLNGNVLTGRVTGFSQVLTGWKRVHLERERMFTHGGLLSRNAAATDTHVFIAKHRKSDGTFVRADNLEASDTIVIFDTARPFRGPERDVACVRSIQPFGDEEMDVALGKATSCATPYALKYAYGSSVDPLTDAWTFADGTRSGGVGVIDDCSTAPNLVNVLSSCFHAIDLGAVEGSYRDGFLSVHAPGLEGGEIPYLAQAYFEVASSEDVAHFSKLWFENFFPKTGAPLENAPHNYFHAIGAARAAGEDGYADSNYDWIYLFVGTIDDYGMLPDPTREYIRETTVHEIAHLFDVNPDDCGGHDGRNAWCSAEEPCAGVLCYMNNASPGTGTVHELCRQDLWDGTATNGSIPCPDGAQPWSAGDGAVRTEEDPK